MQETWKVKIKYIFNIALVLFLIFMALTSKSIAVSDEKKNKQAIILVLDETSLEEILNNNTPHMDSLLDNGAIGLMNTRAKSNLLNRGSTYLSLGMGTRTLASTEGGFALGKDEVYPLSNYKLLPSHIRAGELYELYLGKNPLDGEIMNLAIEDIKKIAFESSPNNEVGLLGKTARENNLVIGLIGNSDIKGLSREATMLAMDENGIIPKGSVSSNLLVSDPKVLGGIKLDENKLLKEVDRLLPLVDILFIDYGDTTRIEKSNTLAKNSIGKEQKYKAVERADTFLGKVINKVDLNKTLLMIISPNPSKEMIDRGNFALTPIIMSGENIERGLLTSNTTYREGLVTNFDFGPTILDYFNVSETRNFIGEPIKIIANKKPNETLIHNKSQYLYLRKNRSVFHWSFIILVALTLLALYLPKFKNWKGLSYKMLNYLCFSALAMPLTMMSISLFGYKSIIFDIFYVFGGAFAIAFILNTIFNKNLKSITILAFGTSVLLLIDIFFLKKLMIDSPLGSDAIAGGRFYGIGNDYMGILLGSTLLFVFLFFEFFKVNKTTILSMVLYMFLVTMGLSPFFGANMGGTLSAILILILTLLTVLEKKISFKNIFFILIGVIIGIFILAGLDILFNPNPTHVGKALNSLLIGGWAKFYEIINTKLRQVFWNIINASWNIILFLEIILLVFLYKYKKNDIRLIRKNYPRIFQGLITILLGGTIVFLFNDTGTIASALMLIYLLIPLGLLVNKKKKV